MTTSLTLSQHEKVEVSGGKFPLARSIPSTLTCKYKLSTNSPPLSKGRGKRRFMILENPVARSTSGKSSFVKDKELD